MVISWPSVELDTGGTAVIPLVCPNCMAKADREWRCGYKLPFVGSTRYFQTFYYCTPCSDVIRHQLRTSSIQYVLGFVLGIGLLIGWAMLMDKKVVPGEAFLAVPVLTAAAVLGFGALRRSGKPLGEKMLGRDFAAYHTGMSGLGLGNRSIYKARRQEWLDLLLESNAPKAAGEKPF
jgi:hypothetical protein